MIDYFKHIVGGEDYILNDKITIHNPTLREIKEYGENKYLSDVSYMVMRSYDAAVFLDDVGRDYRDVDDFELFYTVGKNAISSESLLFPNFNIQDFQCGFNTQTQEYILYCDEIIIDKLLFRKIVDAVRAIHFISNKIEINPGSKYAVKVWVQQQRDKMKRNAKKKKDDIGQYGSLVSTMVNMAGFKYDYDTVMNLRISQFLDAFHRINKIQSYNQLMTGIYSGCIDSKKLSKDVFDYFGKIDINRREIDESKIIEV